MPTRKSLRTALTTLTTVATFTAALTAVTALTGPSLAAGVTPADGARAASAGGRTAAAPRAAAGTVLMWEDPAYAGSLYVDAAPGQCPQNRCEIDWWDGDNEISSIKNHSGCTVRLYADDGFQGDYRDIGDGTEHPNLGALGFDNEAESFQFLC